MQGLRRQNVELSHETENQTRRRVYGEYEPLEVRKARSAADAPAASKEYADNAKAALDRMGQAESGTLGPRQSLALPDAVR